MADFTEVNKHLDKALTELIACNKAVVEAKRQALIAGDHALDAQIEVLKLKGVPEMLKRKSKLFMEGALK